MVGAKMIFVVGGSDIWELRSLGIERNLPSEVVSCQEP